MTNLDIIRADIDDILDSSNEYATDITFTVNTKTFNDDASLNEITGTDYTIQALVFPENNSEMIIDDELGEVEFGSAKVYFKYQYTSGSATITPKNDEVVTVNGTKYRITQLKPWIANSSVGYYEGRLVKEKLN